MDTTDHFTNNHLITLLPSENIQPELPSIGKRYGCVFIFREGDNEDIQNVLKYEINIRYCKDLHEKRRRLFWIERISETYINNYQPDLLIDELAYEAGKVFYPLLVETNYSGKFLGIHNDKEILQRWSDIRKKMSNYFSGDEVERYLNIMEKMLNSKEDLDKSFANDLFFNTFFAPVYKNYTQSFSVQSELYYPIMGKINPLKFLVEQKLCKELTDYHAIKIIHSGKMIDERTVLDLERGENYPVNKMLYPDLKPASGTYEAYYTLNPKTIQIRTIDARWELELNIKRTVEVKIHQMDSDSEESDSLIITEDNIQEKKAGFFSWLFND